MLSKLMQILLLSSIAGLAAAADTAVIAERLARHIVFGYTAGSWSADSRELDEMRNADSARFCVAYGTWEVNLKHDLTNLEAVERVCQISIKSVLDEMHLVLARETDEGAVTKAGTRYEAESLSKGVANGCSIIRGYDHPRFGQIEDLCVKRISYYLRQMTVSRRYSVRIEMLTTALRQAETSSSRLLEENSRASNRIGELVAENDRLRANLQAAGRAAPAQGSGSATLPSISARKSGSSIVFSSINSSDREFQCKVKWSIGYTEYGAYKRKSNERTVVVPARHNGTVMTDETTYANLQVTFLDYQCS